MIRSSFIGAPHFFNLNQACLVLVQAFGYSVFLVGSAITRRDYRDVDVRCVLPDDEYEHLFPGGGGQHNALWSIMCASISLYLSQHSGLPIDFQIQQQTRANAQFSGPRQPLGIFVDSRPKRAPMNVEDRMEENLGLLNTAAVLRWLKATLATEAMRKAHENPHSKELIWENP